MSILKTALTAMATISISACASRAQLVETPHSHKIEEIINKVVSECKEMTGINPSSSKLTAASIIETSLNPNEDYEPIANHNRNRDFPYSKIDEVRIKFFKCLDAKIKDNGAVSRVSL